MRQLAASLATALLCAVAGALPSLAAAEAANTQIFQQRTRDGSILLTDRAIPGATTERSWQVRGEDPAAARQRAIDVKAEANLVSERIQRAIEQQRRADLDAERLRVARLDLDRARTADNSYDDGVVVFAPTGLRGLQNRRMHHDGRGPGGPSHGGPHRGHVKGPAPL
jgi:hypothetical protein